MSQVLKFLGLKKQLQITLTYGKTEFIKFMEKDIKPDQLFFFDIFDVKQKKYYGKINHNGFKIRRSNGSLFPESQFTKVVGKISGGENNTELDISLIGWNWFIVLFMLIMTLIFGLALNDILSTKSYGVLIMLVPVFLVFLLVPIFKMRKGVKRFEKYLKAEFTKVDG